MRILNERSVGKWVVAGGGLYLWSIFTRGRPSRKLPSLEEETKWLWAQVRKAKVGLVPDLSDRDVMDERLIDSLASVRSILKEEDQAEFDSIILLFECVVRSVEPGTRDEVIHALCNLIEGYKDISQAGTNEDTRLARNFIQCGTADFYSQIKNASPLVREYGNQLIDRFILFVSSYKEIARIQA